MSVQPFRYRSNFLKNRVTANIDAHVKPNLIQPQKTGFPFRPSTGLLDS